MSADEQISSSGVVCYRGCRHFPPDVSRGGGNVRLP